MSDLVPTEILMDRDAAPIEGDLIFAVCPGHIIRAENARKNLLMGECFHWSALARDVGNALPMIGRMLEKEEIEFAGFYHTMGN